MKETDLLDGFGELMDPEDLTPPGHIRTRLMAAATQDTDGRTSRSPVRGRRRQLAAGGVGVVTAAVTLGVAVTGLSQPTGRTGTDNTADVEVTARQDDSTVVELTSRDVLLTAASKARSRADDVPDPDAFVYTRMLETGVSVSGDSTLEPFEFAAESWLSVDGTRDGLDTINGNLVDQPGCAEASSDCSPTPAYVDDVPTDPDELLSYLREEIDPYATDPAADPYIVFDGAVSFLYQKDVSPQVQAAMYELMADMPELEAIPRVKAADGRTGVGIGLTYHFVDAVVAADEGESGIGAMLQRDERLREQGKDDVRRRTELVFDPETYELIGMRTVALDHEDWHDGSVGSAPTIDVRPGTVLNSRALLERAVVAEPRLRPDGSANSDDVVHDTAESVNGS
jgi:hypothetical protein